jgi:Flp pilus assembly protein CpaB
VALAVVVGSLVAGTVHRAEATRAAFGELRRVPVARSDVAVGDEVEVGDVAWTDLPTALVPPGVAPEPEGRVASEPIAAGEVVLDRRLSGSGSGPVALVPPGGRALALPVDASTPALAVGDRVDLYTPAELAGASLGTDVADAARGVAQGARRVARGATVVAVDAEAVTVAVRASEAAAVARAVLDGAVVVALVGPGTTS